MRLLQFIVLATLLTSCAALVPVAQDVAGIVQVVIKDVMAGLPFEQVLKDTGSDDAQLLVTIIGAILADPKADPATAKVYAVKCQPYLDRANVLAASQRAAREGRVPSE